MNTFGEKFLLVFCTSLGVVIGAALIGPIASILTGNPPIKTMLKIANDIKIWAIAAGIGGTFTTIEILQTGLFEGHFTVVAKQLLYFVAAFFGAQIGYSLIIAVVGGK
ncbi:MAG: YtrH family sporulation protein [Bacillota bacterium]